jgi:hypothetical protein
VSKADTSGCLQATATFDPLRHKAIQPRRVPCFLENTPACLNLCLPQTSLPINRVPFFIYAYLTPYPSHVINDYYPLSMFRTAFGAGPFRSGSALSFIVFFGTPAVRIVEICISWPADCIFEILTAYGSMKEFSFIRLEMDYETPITHGSRIAPCFLIT